MTTDKDIVSALPVLHIALHNDDGSVFQLESVTREQYVSSTIWIYGDKGLESVPAKFKGRGYGSWLAKKKNYRIKFEQEHALLGMPKSRLWCLIAGVWNNKDWTMLKSHSAFSLSRAVFNKLKYVTQTRMVEVFVNGEYHGVYALSEKIRIEVNKIDILSQHNVLDTGYLINYVWGGHLNRSPAISRFKVEKLKKAPGNNFRGNDKTEFFVIKSPHVKYFDIKNGIVEKEYLEQAEYIKEKTQALADTLIALDFDLLQERVNTPSFIDNLIVQELYKNFDYGKGGCYIYKTPEPPFGDGKFYAGPPWDFDWTIDNDYRGWAVTIGHGGANPFATYMYAIPEFKERVIRRWKEVSADVKEFLDSFFIEYLEKPEYEYAFGKNFTHWDRKNQKQAEADWRKSVLQLWGWLINRVKWFDEEWKEAQQF